MLAWSPSKPDDERVADDSELFERWSAGDDAAGQLLFRRHFGAIARFFRNKATDDWQELVQRTFLACVEARSSFRREGSFRSFLFGVAYRQLLRHYEGRGQGRVDATERSAHDLDPTASACVAKHEEERRLLAALRRIPVEYQAILELHYWEFKNPGDPNPATRRAFGCKPTGSHGVPHWFRVLPSPLACAR